MLGVEFLSITLVATSIVDLHVYFFPEDNRPSLIENMPSVIHEQAKSMVGNYILCALKHFNLKLLSAVRNNLIEITMTNRSQV